MTTAALALWLTAITLIIGTTVYFFLKVLNTPPQEGGDHEPPHIKSFDAT
ncbi:MAG: hypothetical protein J0L94_01885 [Rhodothermia bacterium]|nr:hypothetical protein [Rhodothermia bacterium]